MRTMKELEQSHCFETKLEKPKKLSKEEFHTYKKKVLKQTNNLQSMNWDSKAIFAYIVYIKSMVDLADDHYTEILNSSKKKLSLIGSPLYEQLFIHSNLPDKEKIHLVIQQLGGFLNEQNDLEMAHSDHCFDPEMAPGSSFLDIFAKTVQRAYPNGLEIKDSDKKIDRSTLKKNYPDETMLHQFRHQLDKHNVLYVKKYRAKHNLPTDEAAIKKILKNKWFYADPQYHNRALLGIDVTADDIRSGQRVLTKRGLLKKIRKRGFYRKILSADYHSEFIIDEAGELISQWTTKTQETVYQKMPIANGESFNYGERPRYDATKSHNRLDGTPPHYFDPTQRMQIKKNWISPKDDWFYQVIRRLAEKGCRFKKKVK
ncbi:DUF3114 domain-containing protein [Enterococcus wangshanyuanii]|uniref:DUF3114 domain-containing protein n=1 Tax=Enterococcus wangshanyuanii TaxID=2005703 RepID=A0ABQ1PUX8_9ENTE|nr:DUF3114 domain-containing protein [Enterococcus wangshanyuanii]GGD04651.1 hypothetical protein GCM10011573_37680 [Enterococcus wangshanyuanii]